MLPKGSCKTERRSPTVEDLSPALVGRGEKKKNHVAGVISDQTRTRLAEARAQQAEARTEQAKTRTELAETRTEQAETRLSLILRFALAARHCDR
jgi:hypothetical protein